MPIDLFTACQDPSFMAKELLKRCAISSSRMQKVNGVLCLVYKSFDQDLLYNTYIYRRGISNSFMHQLLQKTRDVIKLNNTLLLSCFFRQRDLIEECLDQGANDFESAINISIMLGATHQEIFLEQALRRYNDQRIITVNDDYYYHIKRVARKMNKSILDHREPKYIDLIDFRHEHLFNFMDPYKVPRGNEASAYDCVTYYLAIHRQCINIYCRNCSRRGELEIPIYNWGRDNIIRNVALLTREQCVRIHQLYIRDFQHHRPVTRTNYGDHEHLPVTYPHN